MVWAAHHLALQSVPALVLIHAPRHVERADQVIAGIRAAGLAPVRRTQLAGARKPPGVIVLDTFGELGRVYALGDVAFVGNSLTPPGGGQNLLQPLAQGKPVLIGPYASNFRDVVSDALSHHVAYEVTSVRDLAGRLVSLLRDHGGRRRIEGRALELIRANRGAAALCAEHIHRLLVRACGRAAIGCAEG
jgi:3-deoxy-D-manno-octulosonic-acid transferase